MSYPTDPASFGIEARHAGRIWKRVGRSVFDKPMDVVCEHVEMVLKRLGEDE